jgi:hypothetical protein
VVILGRAFENDGGAGNDEAVDGGYRAENPSGLRQGRIGERLRLSLRR